MNKDETGISIYEGWEFSQIERALERVCLELAQLQVLPPPWIGNILGDSATARFIRASLKNQMWIRFHGVFTTKSTALRDRLDHCFDGWSSNSVERFELTWVSLILALIAQDTFSEFTIKARIIDTIRVSCTSDQKFKQYHIQTAVRYLYFGTQSDQLAALKMAGTFSV